MNLIRYILSHAILLAFIIAIGFAYYYRAQLFSPDVTARIDGLVHQALVFANIKPKDSIVTRQTADVKPLDSVPVTSTTTEKAEPATQTSNESETVSADTEVAIVSQQAPAEDAQQSRTETETESEQTSTDTPAPVAENKQQAVTETASTDIEAVAKDSETEVADQKVESEAPVSDKQAVAETPAAQTESEMTPADQFNQARLAFHAGKLDEAVSLYKKITESSPDEANAWGEMGNVYYAQGKWQQAGQSYYEAATRLLAQGHTGQVQYLYRVIQGLDKESAKKLAGKIK